MRLLRNLSVVSGFTLLSRIMGFVRDMLTSRALGAGSVADIFFQALTIPNTFRRILAEGAFNAAFVPLYAKTDEGDGRDAADRFASEALSFLVTVTFGVVVLFQLAAPWLVYVFFPGLSDDPTGRVLAVLLLQITMPYLLCMAVTALISGVLNSQGRFAVAAAAPTLFNVVLISLLVYATYIRPVTPDILVTWLSAGVTLSGVMQAAWLWLSARQAKLSIRFKMPQLTPKVARLIKLGVPGALAAAATQINVLVTSSIATLEEGARSWLYYAERLYQLPLGVIGIAMGVALLPNLSRRVRAGDKVGGDYAMNRAIELSLLLTVPAAVAFVFIPDFLVRGLFEGGHFTSLDTARTAPVLILYGLGLPAFVLVKVLAPGFFAREDTKTPMQYAMASMVLNLVVGVGLFFGGMGYLGLAVATTLAGWLNAGLLAFTLYRKDLLVLDQGSKSRLPRIMLAALAMGAGCWALVYMGLPALAQVWDYTALPLDRPLVMAATVLAGGVIFGGVALGIRAVSPRDLRQALKSGPKTPSEPKLETPSGQDDSVSKA
ncbi:murein biosynthesis integral membrane protein MurJ [Woodsholea maritima]|uniref:murein biosynthesis integral membrane protein MurJ n=1 Tax=Woodsholea maritima TaxID=240237 RepID=UPI0003A07059|nr:murein biosynthesis integral membrane protein MurJ [Woodsholea maritima]